MAEFKHQIPISAPAEKVYAALATSAGLKGWWTADSKADEKVAGKAEFGFDRRSVGFPDDHRETRPRKAGRVDLPRRRRSRVERHDLKLDHHTRRQGQHTALYT